MKISSFCTQLLFSGYFCIFITFYAGAKTPKLDSLEQVLFHHSKEDTVKANLLLSICKESFKDNDRDKVLLRTASQLLTLSNKLLYTKGVAYAFYYLSFTEPENTEYANGDTYLQKALKSMRQLGDQRGIALCYEGIGKRLEKNNKYQEAIKFYSDAIQIREKIGDSKGVADSYSRIARVYTHIGSYDKALEHYIKALKIAETINYKSKICESYISLGVIFFEQKKYRETIDYMNKALAIEGKLTNRQNLSYIYNNLAISYQYLNDHTTSLSFHFKALKLNEEMENDAGTAVSCNNISGVYASIGKRKEALYYILKSVALNEKNDDKVGLTYSYIGAGDCYKDTKNFAKAYDYYLKALKMAQQIHYRTEEREAYEHLAILSEDMNDYQKALEYHKKYAQLKDSILSEESLKQTSELNIRYETEKKEKEILLLTKDQELKSRNIKEQRLVRIGLITGLVLLAIVSFLLFNRYRFKQKANLLLEKQKQEIQKKNTLITDSIDYAKTIQDAILPDNEHLLSFLPTHFILYKPKDIVSGDFYWIARKEDKILCAVADCTGHGVPGAFMSLLGHNMLENVIHQKDLSTPGAILTAMNQQISTRFSKDHEASKHGMDIAVISIDTITHQLNYAGAKNALYIVRENKLLEIKGDKVALGTPSKNNTPHDYINHVVQLQKNDMIYLFSDGFPDQKGGPEMKKFFYQPFKDLLVSISLLSPEEQKEHLDSAITDWIGTGEQIDDILILGIRY